MHHTDAPQLYDLLDELLSLRREVVNDAQRRLTFFGNNYPEQNYSKSACNLAEYLSLRQRDLRPLQDQLAILGLSSLGRSEAHVVSTLDNVIELLCRILQINPEPDTNTITGPDYQEGLEILSGNITRMFGPKRDFRNTYIMVTMPPGTANDYSLVSSMFDAGMDCARINCAHDDADTWRKIIANIRQAEMNAGRKCKIIMDLAGHKIRTGPVLTMPGVCHIKVKKDFVNKKQSPANVILMQEEQIQGIKKDSSGSNYKLYIPSELHHRLAPGDRLVFNDIRDKQRSLQIMYRIRGDYWLARCNKNMYLADETLFRWERPDHNNKFIALGEYSFSGIGDVPVEIRLHKDDRLKLTHDPLPGAAAVYDEQGKCISHAHISCTTPAVLDDLNIGDPVWIDDGKLGAIVESRMNDDVILKITYCSPSGMHLKADKGINLPDTELNLPALTNKDLRDLDFICEHADIIGFSFVETLADIDCLLDEMDKRNAQHLAIIAKIETKRAVKNLPEILLGTIGRRQLGIMIARGDLAIELGPEQLSEIQEEILWLCEAAHIPVVWATQVLETLVKKGVISRPEYSDAAMGERADCIMLNKGPYIMHALQALNDILVRMQAHQRKKQSLLCTLQW